MAYHHQDMPGIPTQEPHRSLRERLPTIRGLGRGTLVMAGILVGSAYSFTRSAANLVERAGDAYEKYDKD